ncbi:uncharacterized protein MONOS_14850 [Monocercomonoides exilis]|uniref:uncharacterized protein n=1 Tax=Monocercomonoides exilis TaxID=2049356 RepID=UPI00355A7B23|nr:hypothetical protein MONOS_14850 [Monocercomonoides exilis]|eukprot:MONOS_14850.1-p1 / transcript=MONOS_14850.1 / gene=MONOS_14850 / organism=Monocercomonoides_exilis_PA203 / gene_product=unspecified product / transcript_product=unspecified product / location=Mono_scaffold01086:6289-12198(+) / protein_length=1811 / sequence_SO=supercontig / SO=protein_coding / is_pseudo=false
MSTFLSTPQTQKPGGLTLDFSYIQEMQPASFSDSDYEDISASELLEEIPGPDALEHKIDFTEAPTKLINAIGPSITCLIEKSVKTEEALCIEAEGDEKSPSASPHRITELVALLKSTDWKEKLGAITALFGAVTSYIKDSAVTDAMSRTSHQEVVDSLFRICIHMDVHKSKHVRVAAEFLNCSALLCEASVEKSVTSLQVIRVITLEAIGAVLPMAIDKIGATATELPAKQFLTNCCLLYSPIVVCPKVFEMIQTTKNQKATTSALGWLLKDVIQRFGCEYVNLSITHNFLVPFFSDRQATVKNLAFSCSGLLLRSYGSEYADVLNEDQKVTDDHRSSIQKKADDTSGLPLQEPELFPLSSRIGDASHSFQTEIPDGENELSHVSEPIQAARSGKSMQSSSPVASPFNEPSSFPPRSPQQSSKVFNQSSSLCSPMISSRTSSDLIIEHKMKASPSNLSSSSSASASASASSSSYAASASASASASSSSYMYTSSSPSPSSSSSSSVSTNMRMDNEIDSLPLHSLDSPSAPNRQEQANKMTVSPNESKHSSPSQAMDKSPEQAPKQQYAPPQHDMQNPLSGPISQLRASLAAATSNGLTSDTAMSSHQPSSSSSSYFGYLTAEEYTSVEQVASAVTSNSQSITAEMLADLVKCLSELFAHPNRTIAIACIRLSELLIRCMKDKASTYATILSVHIFSFLGADDEGAMQRQLQSHKAELIEKERQRHVLEQQQKALYQQQVEVYQQQLCLLPPSQQRLLPPPLPLPLPALPSQEYQFETQLPSLLLSHPNSIETLSSAASSALDAFAAGVGITQLLPPASTLLGVDSHKQRRAVLEWLLPQVAQWAQQTQPTAQQSEKDLFKDGISQCIRPLVWKYSASSSYVKHMMKLLFIEVIRAAGVDAVVLEANQLPQREMDEVISALQFAKLAAQSAQPLIGFMMGLEREKEEERRSERMRRENERQSMDIEGMQQSPQRMSETMQNMMSSSSSSFPSSSSLSSLPSSISPANVSSLHSTSQLSSSMADASSTSSTTPSQPSTSQFAFQPSTLQQIQPNQPKVQTPLQPPFALPSSTFTITSSASFPSSSLQPAVCFSADQWLSIAQTVFGSSSSSSFSSSSSSSSSSSTPSSSLLSAEDSINALITDPSNAQKFYSMFAVQYPNAETLEPLKSVLPFFVSLFTKHFQTLFTKMFSSLQSFPANPQMAQHLLLLIHNSLDFLSFLFTSDITVNEIPFDILQQLVETLIIARLEPALPKMGEPFAVLSQKVESRGNDILERADRTDVMRILIRLLGKDNLPGTVLPLSPAAGAIPEVLWENDSFINRKSRVVTKLLFHFTQALTSSASRICLNELVPDIDLFLSASQQAISFSATQFQASSAAGPASQYALDARSIFRIRLMKTILCALIHLSPDRGLSVLLALRRSPVNPPFTLSIIRSIIHIQHGTDALSHADQAARDICGWGDALASSNAMITTKTQMIQTEGVSSVADPSFFSLPDILQLSSTLPAAFRRSMARILHPGFDLRAKLGKYGTQATISQTVGGFSSPFPLYKSSKPIQNKENEITAAPKDIKMKEPPAIDVKSDSPSLKVGQEQQMPIATPQRPAQILTSSPFKANSPHISTRTTQEKTPALTPTRVRPQTASHLSTSCIPLEHSPYRRVRAQSPAPCVKEPQYCSGKRHCTEWGRTSLSSSIFSPRQTSPQKHSGIRYIPPPQHPETPSRRGRAVSACRTPSRESSLLPVLTYEYNKEMNDGGSSRVFSLIKEDRIKYKEAIMSSSQQWNSQRTSFELNRTRGRTADSSLTTPVYPEMARRRSPL